MADTFKFDREFQDAILVHFLAQPDLFLRYGEILKASYFEGAQSTVVAYALFGYTKEYGKAPSWPVLKQLTLEQNKKLGLSTDDEVLDYIARLREIDPTDGEFVVSKVISFARERATIGAIRQSIELIKESKTPEDGFVKLFQDATQIGMDLDDLGLLFHADYKEVISKITASDYGTPTGFPQWDKIWKRGWGPGWLIVILAPPKRYKCLAGQTLVMFYDGSIRPASTVKVGDLLMGDDSTPRKVLSAGTGRGPMYRVHQRFGENFDCNDAHTLCLKTEEGGLDRLVECKKLYDMRQAGTANARNWQGYKVGVEFPDVDVPLEPYFFGLWLGNGTADEPAVCVCDKDVEVETYVRDFSAREGYWINTIPQRGCVRMVIRENETQRTKRPSRLMAALNALGVTGNASVNKHIPDRYKFNSREKRLELLAGLLDTDGSNVKNKGLVYISANLKLAKDVEWLARSLGFLTKFRSYVSRETRTGFEGNDCRVEISGKISQIPIKTARKKAPDSKKHRHNNYRIKIESLGEGDWCGFEVDGNHKFLLGDFTVTHNSTLLLNIALNIIGPMVEGDVLYYPCEITQELAFARALNNITQRGMDDLYTNTEKFTEAVGEAMVTRAAGNLVMKGYPAGTATLTTIRNHARMAIQHYNLKNLKAIMIDYADTVLPSQTYDAEYLRQAGVYTEARAMGKEFNCPIIMPDRTTRAATDMKVPDMKAFQGAFAKGGIVDVAIGNCMTDEEYAENIFRTFVFVNRHGAAFQHLRGKIDPETATIDLGEEIPYDPEDNDARVSPRRRRSRDRDDLAQIDE